MSPTGSDREFHARPSRLGRLFLWAERKGWRLNFALLLATLVTTSLAGGGLIAFGDPFWPLVWPFELLARPRQAMGDLRQGLMAGLPYGLSVISILGAHELGHYLACRYYGVRATLPFFIPCPLMFGTFGAVIRIKQTVPTRKALFDIGIAGPLAGFAVLVPILTYGLATADVGTIEETAPSEVFAAPPLCSVLLSLMKTTTSPDDGLLLNSYILAAWIGMLATALNLFPSGQLDGGHICYAISRRLHRFASKATILGLSVLLVYGTVFYRSPAWLVWVIVLALMGPRHPMVIDESQGLSTGRLGLALLAAVVFYLSFAPVPFYSLAP
jgi:membrane-associated protease RseP (regulator of RpoE activity)